MKNDEVKQTLVSGGSPLNDGLGKQYDNRNPISQGVYYLRHVQAMTAENLHSKADIAKELAHRDIEIDKLKKLIAVAAMPLEVLVCSCSHKMHTDETARAIEEAVTEIRNYFGQQIMSLTVPKNEREHLAARRIKLLETALNTAMSSLKQISETPRNAGARRNASATVKFLQTQGIDA